MLHGLPENYWETENDVIDRVISIFYDLLNINLTDYIEGIEFIGKRNRNNNKNRPIKIELISKRMKRYILENSWYLKEAGLSATEYLGPIALQERRKLREALQTARQNGQHAVIKNNILIINGKEMNLTTQQSQDRKSKTVENLDGDPENVERSNLSQSQLPLSSPPVPFSLTPQCPKSTINKHNNQILPFRN